MIKNALYLLVLAVIIYVIYSNLYPSFDRGSFNERKQNIASNEVVIDQGGSASPLPKNRYNSYADPGQSVDNLGVLGRDYDTEPYSFAYGSDGEIPEESLEGIQTPDDAVHPDPYSGA